MLTRTKGKVDQRSEENRQCLLLAALHFAAAKEEQPLVTQVAEFEEDGPFVGTLPALQSSMQA